MLPRKYEIYLAAIPLRGNTVRHNWLVVESASPSPHDHFFQRVGALPISSEEALFDDHLHFPLRRIDLDFPRTGLWLNSYVIGDEPTLIPIDRLLFIRGELLGELLDEFTEWREQH